jgi:hypothetical protein
MARSFQEEPLKTSKSSAPRVVGEASYIDKFQQTRGIQVQNKVQIFHS